MSQLATSAVPFEIKSAQLPLVALLLHSADPITLEAEFQRRFGEQSDFFDQDPLLLDLSGLENTAATLDMPSLLPLLQRLRLRPVAYKGGTAAQQHAAAQAGLVLGSEATWARVPNEAAAPVAAMAATEPPLSQAALVVDKPLRSGQQIYARGRDLVVMAMVNPGAEVIADGHIHVYAPLRGKAIAGARGNADARIFAQAMEPELVSIAGVYRTSDVALPDNVRGKAAQVRLHSGADGDKLLLEPLI